MYIQRINFTQTHNQKQKSSKLPKHASTTYKLLLLSRDKRTGNELLDGSCKTVNFFHKILLIFTIRLYFIVSYKLTRNIKNNLMEFFLINVAVLKLHFIKIEWPLN